MQNVVKDVAPMLKRVPLYGKHFSICKVTVGRVVTEAVGVSVGRIKTFCQAVFNVSLTEALAI